MVINMKTTVPGFSGVPPESVGVLSSGSVPREHGLYEKELDTYLCVAKGDCEGVRAAAEALISEKTAQGGLDVKSIDEAKYRVSEIINIAARYAAGSGPDERLCIRLADECVNETDKLTSRDEIYRILIERIVELTRLVSQAQKSREYPYSVRRAIGYINANLDKNLTVIDVARECRLSADYMSVCFRKATGVKMTAYIRRQKMLLARDMLGRHIRCSDAALRLAFCSESYFVKCFKEEFGITPKKWQNSV